MIFPEVEPERIVSQTNTSILRGNIYDRNGAILALSKRVYNVVVHPDIIKSKKDLNMNYLKNMSSTISEILNIEEKYVMKKMVSDSMFQYIKKGIDEYLKGKLESYNFVGLKFEPAFKREYPTENLMSHIIGFIGYDNNGLEAIEKQFNNKLLNIKNGSETKNYIGNNLYLTIDKKIQEIVKNNLKKGMDKFSAAGAVGIVYNPMSSEILAMCSLPDYNPYTRKPTPNSALAEAVEPGSVFKIFVSTILLDNKIVSPNTITDCNTPVNINGRIINPNTNHQKLKFEEVFKYSSNVGVIRNSLKLTDDQFYNGIQQFGFGRKTGIDFPIESQGIFKPLEKIGSQQSKAMMSIGYEISVTPIQLVVALSSLINGGHITKPLLASEIRNTAGKIIEKFETKIINYSPGINYESANAVLDMMRGVVQEGGTGKEANIKGVDIIGKTGTAQRYIPELGYTNDKVNTTFIGIVKFLKDPIIVVVIFYSPDEGWSSKTAAPVFKNIVQEMIDYGLIFEY